jgi:hypothetical protein
MVPACGTSPWLWQVAGLVRGCRSERPGNNVRNMLSESYGSINHCVASSWVYSLLIIDDARTNTHQINVRIWEKKWNDLVEKIMLRIIFPIFNLKPTHLRNGSNTS